MLTHHIQDESLIALLVKPSDRAEVAIPCLQECLPAVADYHMLLATLTGAAQLLPEVLQGKGPMAVQLHTGTVAAGKACSLRVQAGRQEAHVEPQRLCGRYW